MTVGQNEIVSNVVDFTLINDVTYAAPIKEDISIQSLGNGSFKIIGSAGTLPYLYSSEAQVFTSPNREPGTFLGYKAVNQDGSFELTINTNLTEIWIVGAYLDQGWQYSEAVKLDLPQ